MSKTVLFDLDGTLIHTAPDFVHIVNEMCAARGLPAVDADAFTAQIARGSANMVQHAFDLTETDALYEATLNEFYQEYLTKMGEHAELFTGIAELLAQFTKNDITWGVVTNRKLDFIPKILQQFGLYDLSQCIVGSDSTPHRKPHPGPLLYAIEQLGVPSKDCYYVGDFPTDIEAAKAAGIASIAVTWGYHDGLDTLRAAEPDYLVDEADEILEIILQ
jgi:phosphoglycolate phosphatase